MAALLLLLVVLAGPGPGAAASAPQVAATAAAAPQHNWHSHWLSHSTQPQQQPLVRHTSRATAAGSVSLHRHLLQEQVTAAGCNATSELPGCDKCSLDGGVWTCNSCAGSLLLIRALNACGCPQGAYNTGGPTCRDCPKGSFCPGGRYTGEDGVPPQIPCASFSPGLTTLGVRTTRREGCVNLPGWSFSTVGPDNAPLVSPCPADTYSFGLRKQRACVACPPGYNTAGKTMQTSIASCDVDACNEAPCGKNMDCTDLPKPALGGPTGRNCTCIPGTTYVDEVMGCSDPAETAMVGAPLPRDRAVSSFELRCPRGAFVVGISGIADSYVRSIPSVSCSDGTGAPLVGFGWTTNDNRFTTAMAPDGFTGLVVTGTIEGRLSSVSFDRQDRAYSPTYGTLSDVSVQYGRRQFVSCDNFGIAIGLTGVRTTADGAPLRLGLICSGLPCAVRPNSMFGPANAGVVFGAPGSYLANSPPPISTATATQCCSSCTHDYLCQYWVREDSTGQCWLIYREPSTAGSLIPAEWGFQSVPGYSSGATQTKASGISVSGTYIGCYREPSCNPALRLRAVLAQNEKQMTVKQCLASALQAGWPYAGLAPGTIPGTTSCFGGDRVPSVAVNPGCFAPCSGNSSERCGDNNCFMSVYSVLKPRWPLNIINTGDATRGSGWYDIQCQGALNDYCRWLGRDNSSYFSCALAGSTSPNTLPGEISESVTGSACQEPGYKAQALTDLSCVAGDLSLPWENSCRTRQCCKAKCDGDPLCNGFVWGNSAGDNCRSPGDGSNCCWLKGGECRSVFNPLTSAYRKTAEAAVCNGFPADPPHGVMFCPNNGQVGFWPQGTRCNVECLYGIVNSDQRPYTICQSNGEFSEVIGLCKPPCTLPPLLCP